MPDANGQPLLVFPNCFALHAEGGWFREIILRRLDRQHHRAMWGLTHTNRKTWENRENRHAGGNEGTRGNEGADKEHPAGRKSADLYGR